MSDEESREKKYAYLSSSKQRVVFLGPPTDRPDIDGFTSIADTKKQTFFQKFISYTKKNPFVLAGFGVCFYAFIQGLRATKRKDKVMITKMMGLRAASGAFIITALCVGNLYHEGKLIPQSKIEEEIDMQKRLANVYFMAKKRKMEAESGEEIQI